ncbi:ABC transporter permease [Wukongibacter sp. M2B1]|uniref:ABC transporter permease n=1 Tax=Wukongibacter sp. M2B1 TaxID=3088895 RepID=UPI003D791CA0
MKNFSIPLAEIVNKFFDNYINYIAPITRQISEVLDSLIDINEKLLLFVNPFILILLLTLLVWFLIKSKKLCSFVVISLVFILGLDLWNEALSTLALVITGTFISLLIAIPLGIAASLSDRFQRILRPVLDLMQTLPSFVYLIPAVMFFGLGKTSALVAILIFSMPPAIRLTNLGIREVPVDKIEAARAFGATKLQILTGVQLPLATKTIMAGVNQCIMMALSMSVIAAMIGAGGLGRGVLTAMQTVDIGMGIEGGLGIVILAVLLDRTTEHLAKKQEV